jgi:uncharacterized protein (TIGR02757 family)
MPTRPIASAIRPGAGSLRPFLAALFKRYHSPRWIGVDPLHWPRAYDTPADREVAAFIAAALAYGNVRQIDRSLGNLFTRIGRSPAQFARNFVPGRSDRALSGLYHRFNTDRDFAALLHILGQMLRQEGSIEGFWNTAQLGGDRAPLAVQAGRFIDAALRLDLAPYFPADAPRPAASLRYLLPDLAGPSACKRFFLFLRWVVRPDDGVDLGLWSSIAPARLQFPVDTHLLRLSRYLGATDRRDATAKTRAAITDFFRQIDPLDPVRFDFSLCRLGIEKFCPSRMEPGACQPCELRPACLRHACMTWPGRLPRSLARLNLIEAPAKPRTRRRRLRAAP